ncbi:IS3 family transposase [Halobacillus shinanisalinarum]|uniref:IS3 family transposase n=1 Tax=Halobacillus shinanisalinarum TaxID=2932258 RepID=A0ABY4H6B8_9BACI|nr:IS3 family transposase [Halobacillus shinanisalinarum]
MEKHRHEFRVAKMCQVLGVSKGGFYEWRKRSQSNQERRKEKRTAQVKRVYVESQRRYGSPKITKELKQQGWNVSQKTVTRIMRENGLRSKTVKKYKATTNSKHSYPIYPNLLNQQFQVNRPGAVWVSDITYVWTKEGWLYLATVMDLFSRRIIGWEMSHRMTKALTIRALQRAMDQQPPKEGLIHHSDRGSQYAANEYQAILRNNDVTTSMSRKGNCYDNACIESFHSVLKKELIFHENYQTREEAKRSLFAYIMTFYNYKRIHSAIQYMSPIAYEKSISKR